jgi:peptidyl-tRNA hydrolase
MDERPAVLYTDPEGEVPWAMQLVARVERAEPGEGAIHTAVCEAAAMAVVRLLYDERSAPGGEWHEQVQRWTAGRIRKLVRRARGAPWARAAALGGVLVDHEGAEVLALPPGPTDQLPPELNKLQVGGLDLPDPGRRAEARPEPGWPGVVVALTPLSELGTGKAAAAAGHAAQLAALRMEPDRRRRGARWAEAGFPVLVEHPGRDRWAALVASAPVEVVDAGFTVVEPGTRTAVAWWPG